MPEKDIKVESSQDFEETLSDISKKHDGKECTLIDLEEIVKEMLSTLPKLNRDKLRKEMNDMYVEVHANPTTFDINEGLASSQGYRTRLTEIYNLAIRECKLRKRCVELLFSAVNVISNAKSKDKRDGEAVMKYPIHVLNLEASEIFLEEVNQIINNIRAVSDSVSRQGSMLQMQVQIGEYTRRSSGDRSESTSEAEELRGIDYKSGVKKLSWSDV